MIAFAFGQTELAVDVIELLLSQHRNLDALQGPIGEFVRDIVRVWNSTPKHYLAQWKQDQNAVPIDCRSTPIRPTMRHKLREFKDMVIGNDERRKSDYSIVRHMFRHIYGQLRLLTARSSPIEKVLERWGMGEQAQALRINRFVF